MTDNQITYQIRGAIYDVYKALGPGLLDLKVGILVNFNTDDILEDSIHRVVNGL